VRMSRGERLTILGLLIGSMDLGATVVFGLMTVGVSVPVVVALIVSSAIGLVLVTVSFGYLLGRSLKYGRLSREVREVASAIQLTRKGAHIVVERTGTIEVDASALILQILPQCASGDIVVPGDEPKVEW